MNIAAVYRFSPKGIQSRWCWPRQSVTRSLFQFSRREREFHSFNLMFETRTRISFSQSRASRREREFLFSISGFETRTRIEIETILARIFENYIYCLFNDRYFQKKNCYFLKISKNNMYVILEKFEYKSHFSRWEREFFFNISCLETRTGISLF